jgi:sterol desaturase/sphingolipid hydroxylase (fatty acid hydroxylase superfamily)
MIVDFLRYWWHRAMHASKTLWKFHTVHHSATSFTVITGDRIHPVEDVPAVPLVVFPLVLLGATTAQAVIVVTMLRLIDMAQHSILPFTYG